MGQRVENYTTCLVCLESDTKSKLSKCDNLLELELTTFVKLFDLKTNLRSNVDQVSLCQRCCHTLQRVHHQMAELQCLEQQIENSKKEIKDRMMNYTTSTNLSGIGIGSPFNSYFRIREQVKKEIESCSSLSIIKRKEICTTKSTTSIFKIGQGGPSGNDRIRIAKNTSDNLDGNDKLKLCKKFLQVRLVPLNIPVHPKKSYILLDQLSKSVKDAETRNETSCPPSPTKDIKKLPKIVHSSYRKKGLHYCTYCRKGYTRLDHLEVHKNIHLGITPFKCDVDEKCTLSFPTKTLRALHRLTHKNKKDKTCEFCQKSFINSYQLELHRNIHTGLKPWKCEEYNCNLAFRTKTLRNLHKLSAHKKKKKRYHCQDCSKSFRKLSCFEIHRNVHTGSKPYKCEFENCSKAFPSPALLKLHRQTHKTCEFCQKSFINSYQLELHRHIHTGVKPWKCEEYNCNLAFRTKTLRSLHKLSAHKKKRYHCKDCSKSFRKLSCFEIHRNVHTGSKPYKCEFENCSKAFPSPALLKLHSVQRHKYPCLNCKTYFASIAQLNKHSNSFHSREVHKSEAFKSKSSNKNMPKKISIKYTTKSGSIKNYEYPYKYKQKNIKKEKCGKCDLVFEHFADLEKHINLHLHQDHLMSSRLSSSSTDSSFVVPDDTNYANDNDFDDFQIETKKEDLENLPVLDDFESAIINKYFVQPSNSEITSNQEQETSDPLRIDSNVVNSIGNHHIMGQNQTNYHLIQSQNQIQPETGHQLQTLNSNHNSLNQVFLTQILQNQGVQPESRQIIAVLIPSGSTNQVNNIPNYFINSQTGSVDSQLQLPISIVKSYSINKLSDELMIDSNDQNRQICKKKYDHCPICNKILFKTGISRHIKTVHSVHNNMEKQKKYSCKHGGCEDVFDTPDQLKCHVTITHLDPLQPQDIPTSDQNDKEMETTETEEALGDKEIDLLVEKSFANTEFDNILGL